MLQAWRGRCRPPRRRTYLPLSPAVKHTTLTVRVKCMYFTRRAHLILTICNASYTLKTSSGYNLFRATHSRFPISRFDFQRYAPSNAEPALLFLERNALDILQTIVLYYCFSSPASVLSKPLEQLLGVRPNSLRAAGFLPSLVMLRQLYLDPISLCKMWNVLLGNLLLLEVGQLLACRT